MVRIDHWIKLHINHSRSLGSNEVNMYVRFYASEQLYLPFYLSVVLDSLSIRVDYRPMKRYFDCQLSKWYRSTIDCCMTKGWFSTVGTLSVDNLLINDYTSTVDSWRNVRRTICRTIVDCLNDYMSIICRTIVDCLNDYTSTICRTIVAA